MCGALCTEVAEGSEKGDPKRGIRKGGSEKGDPKRGIQEQIPLLSDLRVTRKFCLWSDPTIKNTYASLLGHSKVVFVLGSFWRGVQWMGVVVYNKPVYNTVSAAPPFDES